MGTWKGELTQDPDSKYYFEINIDEIDKYGNFTGTTYEKIIPMGKSHGKSKDYVKLSCNGFVEGIAKKMSQTNLFVWPRPFSQNLVQDLHTNQGQDLAQDFQISAEISTKVSARIWVLAETL